MKNILLSDMHKYANDINPFSRRVFVFKSLACERRLRIVEILRYGPHTVGEASHFLGLHPSVVSRHLNFLFNAGLLKMEKRGKEVYYSLKEPSLIVKLFEIVDKIRR